MPQPSLLFVLRERAGLQPDDTAFTYTDFEQDYAEDIESTAQKITGGRVAAISVPIEQTEKLFAIIELKKRVGKIRRSACVEHYRGEQFIRLDA